MIEKRKQSFSEKSFTCKLLKDPLLLIEKVSEESEELIEAAEIKEKKEVIWEAADLLYFLMVLLAKREVKLKEVFMELERRNNEKN
ncbi:MAG: phosphoribosyl-ATP diphosphatase [Candidatus Diapherotrites archaeon CG10_big_fil_rev_8_21_14_0_10_31_34]|nr:MAG: phosphoribosyl-ATP diphosphatase [Candidatus Diapherotrites archaeon CG10_big_fil_rev_8_21_14_0_10_31_34]